MFSYHFRIDHHTQSEYLQDKHMQRSCRRNVSQWQHIFEIWSKDCWLGKDFDIFPACKSFGEDNLCPPYTLVLLIQQLQTQKQAMQFLVRFWSVHDSALTLYTCCITISLQWESAGARFPMIFGSTVCTKGTVAWIAKGLTFLPGVATARNKTAFLISGTIIVLAATSLNASHKRIALKSRRTNTNWNVVVHFTKCSWSTLSCQTWINTLLRFASFV